MNDYEALKQAAIAYLRAPHDGTRDALAQLVGEPLIPRVPGAFLAARGAFNWEPGDEPAEVTIRRLRDGDEE